MWLSLLAIPAGILLGFGVTAYLVYADARQGLHAPAMTGPKLQKALLKKYKLLGVLGFVGWVAVTRIGTNWLAFVLGLVGAVIGRWLFHRLDRHMTRYVG